MVLRRTEQKKESTGTNRNTPTCPAAAMSPELADGGPLDPTTNQNVRHGTRQTLRQDQNDGPTNRTTKKIRRVQRGRNDGLKNTRKAKKWARLKLDNGGDAWTGLSFFDAGRVSFGTKTKRAFRERLSHRLVRLGSDKLTELTI